MGITVFASRKDDVDIYIRRFGTNKPEKRHHSNRRLLEYKRFKVADVAPLAEEDAITLMETVHDKDYITFLFSAYNMWNGDDVNYSSTGNKKHWDKLKDTHGDFQPYHFQPPAFLGPEGGRSSSFGKIISGNVYSEASFYATDTCTPINKDLKKALVCDVSVIKKSVDGMTRDPAPKVVYAATVHPGHHAFRSHYGGYCYINNACVAGELLLCSENINRIAHLDIDYHSGNGSASIWNGRSDVVFASVHMDPQYDYPYSHFSDSETGNTKEFFVPPKSKWEQYRPILETALDTLLSPRQENEKGPDVLIISLGTDTLAGDPDNGEFGGMNLEISDFAEMGKLFREKVKVPILFVQEGGYQVQKGAEAISALFSELEQ